MNIKNPCLDLDVDARTMAELAADLGFDSVDEYMIAYHKRLNDAIKNNPGVDPSPYIYDRRFELT